VLAIALLAGVVVPAAAQDGTFKFISGTPYPNQPTLTVPGYGTYYTSIYRGQFLSGGPTTAQVDIYCVDFFHSVSVNQEWNAWFSPLSGSMANTYGVRFRNWDLAIAGERYAAAAYLASQFNPADPNKATTWPALQAKIWNLMGQTNTLSNDFTAAGVNSSQFPIAQSGSTLNDAITNGANINGSEWTVISDVGTTKNGVTTYAQEFLVQQSVVPEPETVILLVTGLLAIGAVAYFRGFSA
jgi:hypothetical protein